MFCLEASATLPRQAIVASAEESFSLPSAVKTGRTPKDTRGCRSLRPVSAGTPLALAVRILSILPFRSNLLV
jgi:hypothetical protein